MRFVCSRNKSVNGDRCLTHLPLRRSHGDPWRTLEQRWQHHRREQGCVICSFFFFALFYYIIILFHFNCHCPAARAATAAELPEPESKRRPPDALMVVSWH